MEMYLQEGPETKTSHARRMEIEEVLFEAKKRKKREAKERSILNYRIKGLEIRGPESDRFIVQHYHTLEGIAREYLIGSLNTTPAIRASAIARNVLAKAAAGEEISGRICPIDYPPCPTTKTKSKAKIQKSLSLDEPPAKRLKPLVVRDPYEGDVFENLGFGPEPATQMSA